MLTSSDLFDEIPASMDPALLDFGPKHPLVRYVQCADLVRRNVSDSKTVVELSQSWQAVKDFVKEINITGYPLGELKPITLLLCATGLFLVEKDLRSVHNWVTPIKLIGTEWPSDEVEAIAQLLISVITDNDPPEFVRFPKAPKVLSAVWDYRDYLYDAELHRLSRWAQRDRSWETQVLVLCLVTALDSWYLDMTFRRNESMQFVSRRYSFSR